jgi:hypothetical protein
MGRPWAGYMATIGIGPTTMQATFPLVFDRNLRRGPFVFFLTHLHQSNIFVDDDWHITSLVDLEWACSLPVEMVQPPHWLARERAFDCIVSEEYDPFRREFMAALTTVLGSGYCV